MGISDKPALILLHGFCENSYLWEHVVPHLTYKGRIITPDLPGFGNSNLLFNEFSLDDISTYLYESLKKDSVSSCICIGHSLGGYITLAFKRNYPEFVKKIGLVHSTAFEDTPEKKEGRNKLIDFLNENPSSRFLSTFAYTLFCETNKSRLSNEIEKVVHMSDGLAGTTIQAYATAMRDRRNSIDVLTNEESPLFIAGECDNSVPVEMSKKQIALINNKKHCYILENVAHMGMYENSNTVIGAIDKFLKE